MAGLCRLSRRPPGGPHSAQTDRLHLERYQDATGFFGFLDALDDAQVFDALFKQAEDWLRSRGMQRARGPFSLNINQEVGLLVEGFETRPYFMMGDAWPYYGAHVERQGYAKAVDVFAYLISSHFQPPPVMASLFERLRRRIHIRPLDPKRKDAELDMVCDIFNDAWAENWGFVPFTRDEFRSIGHEMLMLIPPNFIQIAEMDGEAVAFIVLLPQPQRGDRGLEWRAAALWLGQAYQAPQVRLSEHGTHSLDGRAAQIPSHTFRAGPGAVGGRGPARTRQGQGHQGSRDVVDPRDQRRHEEHHRHPGRPSVQALSHLRENARVSLGARNDLQSRSPRAGARDPSLPWPAIVLAGERPGGNALARAHHLPASVLVPVAGKPCLARVITTLRACQSIDGGLLVGPSADIVQTNDILRELLAIGDFRWLEPMRGPSASALRAAGALRHYPVLLTTGDHALLEVGVLDCFCTAAAASAADFVVGLVPHALVHALLSPVETHGAAFSRWRLVRFESVRVAHPCRTPRT